MNLSGRVSDGIQFLSSLSYFNISCNSFASSLPKSLSNLTSMKTFDVSQNFFTGSFPSGLGRAAELRSINASSNDFSGLLPEDIGNATMLESLDFRGSYFVSPIPKSFTNLQKLKFLGLSGNNFKGEIPDYLGELSSLETLIMGYNEFKGEIPAEFGNLTNLQYLDLAVGTLSGQIPPELGKLKNLTTVYLYRNNFTGKIPPQLGSIMSLVFLDLSDNQISGEIPEELANLENLQLLNLMSNEVTGLVPNKLGELKNLQVLELWKNSLEGPLPVNLGKNSPLQWLDVSSNSLSGEIPPGLCTTGNLTKLILFNNSFSGSIPTGLSNCLSLVLNLNLRNNQLTGGIPKSITNMPTLSVLDLSNNSLTGEIPENFGISPALETLNLSYNKLEGPVPSNGILMSRNPNDLVGNPGLLILSIAAAYLAGRFIYNRTYLYNSFIHDWFKSSNEDWPWRLVAFQRVSFTSTEILTCIQESNVIGMGATGIVYKAEIHNRPHMTVAVKKLRRSGSDIENGYSDVVREVELLGKLRHRNIVRLLGYVHNERDVIMVYEYMANGNLGNALHSGEQCERLLVDWVSRYNIALGVAQGLHYLHHDCHPPVIHRDIKSNNILLDANLEARIADFGLAKMMIHKNETVSIVAGSYGYIAPEYGYTLKVDEKIDIYSYGVVLLELVTGKMPLDPSFGEYVDIVEWIRKKKSNKALEEALDPSIAGQCKHVQEEMLLVLRIALLCTVKLPKERPSMKDVITMLGEAKPRRKSVCRDSRAQDGALEKPIFTASPVVSLL
ncbi:hypothetical protein Ahy_B09g096902 isoform B [Arachis hypogaea]|uniref:Protein kinase domain-containing protein n=1 Tax=Arachis hypogaea TaxID=3818 RepID=A0A444XN01_ARAHY|nr:hypothetical protein Ahy_B09g096902 isoform B [Arachis hypogaea]